MTTTLPLPITAPFLQLEVYGEPRPKGSKSAVVIAGRARVIESKSANGRRMQESWKDAVRVAATEWRNANPGPVLTVPLAVTFAFWLPRPASAPKRVTLPAKKPDYDKLARLVGDVLKGIVYADDALIVDAHITKRFAAGRPPGCTITVEVLA